VFEGRRIVRSGLQGTEEIVVNGLQRVRPGMPVKAQEQAHPVAVASDRGDELTETSGSHLADASSSTKQKRPVR
jgi:hypothetical protein